MAVVFIMSSIFIPTSALFVGANVRLFYLYIQMLTYLFVKINKSVRIITIQADAFQ
jgi:hypothetical protein